MAALSDSALTALAEVIRDEVDNGENTATRIGEMFIDLIDSKVNMVKVKVSVSSAEILNMNSAPKTLVAAQGAGTLIHPLFFVVRKNFVSAAYTTNLNVQIAPNTIFSDTRASFLDFTETVITNFSTETGTILPAASAGVDTPINLFVVGGNPVAGDGTLDIYLTYTVITL